MTLVQALMSIREQIESSESVVIGSRRRVEDIEKAFTALTIGGLQLGQVLNIDMNEAEVIVPELAMAML